MFSLTRFTCVAQVCFKLSVCAAVLCFNVKHDLHGIIYVHVQRLPPEVSAHERSPSCTTASETVSCLLRLDFVTVCLFVMRLKSVCPYQFSGWEEITEQKQWVVLYD